ncbi:MAG TPA: sigma-54 dependent transcriptional regulator [candidate division Zixibacteria bacterium]|nr:sigma-54 dependent transcriptional regulator [candidate division Zixibacteria bacterium]
MANILIVDDEPKMTSLVCGQLEDAGHSVMTCTDPAQALELIDKHSFDIVITDLSMPGVSGMTILDKALEKDGTDVIMMTAYGTVETAVEAMKKGAADYMIKPFPLDELEILVRRLVDKQKLTSLSGHYEAVIADQTYADFIGDSPATHEVKQMIRKVASSDATVLLTGRSGTGKEVAARLLHNLSPRKNKPFIAVNCAALTETLLESELFGHEKGAFTGAVGRKRGRFELADGGTIFLDEIAETSTSMQSKLLRVLEERKLVRVGGVDLIGIDVRVVAATNRQLKEEMESGNFREDLFFRLNVFPIHIPGLADRKEDIVPLAEHFLQRLSYPHGRLPSDVAILLESYDWPGNIRELKNVIERATILAGGEPLSTEDFSLDMDVAPITRTDEPGMTTGPRGLESAEKEMILGALRKAEGNKTEAARLLQITRRRLYSRMKVYGIKP